MASQATTPTGRRINDLASKVARRPSNDELADLLEQEARDGNSIRYDHTLGIVVALVAAAVAIIALMNERIVLFVLAGSVVTVFAILIVTRVSAWSSLETSMQRLYEDNLAGLKPVPTTTMPLSFFGEFQRGNYSRDIRKVRVGSRTMNDRSVGYTIVDYHWVQKVKEVETYTDSKGRMRQRVVVRYYHFDRVGIALELGAPGRLCVYSEGGFPVPTETWTTADPEFNKRFEVRSSTEMVAASILKPTVVLKILDLSKVARDLNLEVNARGWMLASFAPTNLAAVDGPQPSLRDLRTAAEIARRPAEQPLLTQFFDVVEDVSRHVAS